jgi:hypothetical protein
MWFLAARGRTRLFRIINKSNGALRAPTRPSQLKYIKYHINNNMKNISFLVQSVVPSLFYAVLNSVLQIASYVGSVKSTLRWLPGFQRLA